jgi:tetratricopeptide (TPR) repeat protein
MIAPSIDPTAAIAAAVKDYQENSDVASLLKELESICTACPDADALVKAVEPFQDIPEIAGPVYEHIVASKPDDAPALVRLANAYWLSGRGPDAVQALANRAIAADPSNRGAWHLWALSESTLRERVDRWRHVVERFPQDELAQANLADNAASLASTEGDRGALQVAIRTYKGLLRTAARTDQRAALERAVATLEQWRL